MRHVDLSIFVAVRALPLLSGEIAIEALKLSGLKANVIRRKDGSMNFSDLAGGNEKAAGKPGEPPNVRISEVIVEKVQLAYRDEATGQELNIAELNLKTGLRELCAGGCFIRLGP